MVTDNKTESPQNTIPNVTPTPSITLSDKQDIIFESICSVQYLYVLDEQTLRVFEFNK